jgi:hypothetical protein
MARSDAVQEKGRINVTSYDQRPYQVLHCPRRLRASIPYMFVLLDVRFPASRRFHPSRAAGAAMYACDGRSEVDCSIGCDT